MPGTLRAGLALLGTGGLADVVLHVTGTAVGHGDLGATVVHATVAAGMAASLAGLVVTALRVSTTSDDERRHT